MCSAEPSLAQKLLTLCPKTSRPELPKSGGSGACHVPPKTQNCWRIRGMFPPKTQNFWLIRDSPAVSGWGMFQGSFGTFDLVTYGLSKSMENRCNMRPASVSKPKVQATGSSFRPFACLFGCLCVSLFVVWLFACLVPLSKKGHDIL